MTMRFAITGRMTDCLQLTYRTPSETVRALLPEGLELVTRGPWAFWDVLACRVERVRPAGVPGKRGLSYRQVAYRLLAQAMTRDAELVQGLYFARSEADRRAANRLGNRLSDMRMHPASIELEASDCGVQVRSRQADGHGTGLHIDATHAPAQLAKDSCFPTLADVRAFSGRLRDGLAVVEDRGERRLRITRVQRSGQACAQTPLAVRDARLGYFESIDQARHVQLEWACRLGARDVVWRVEEPRCLLSPPRPIAPVMQHTG